MLNRNWLSAADAEGFDIAFDEKLIMTCPLKGLKMKGEEVKQMETIVLKIHWNLLEIQDRKRREKILQFHKNLH